MTLKAMHGGKGKLFLDGKRILIVSFFNCIQVASGKKV
jgi:hypothetical protein